MFTIYAKNKIIDALVGNTNYATLAPKCYLGLSKTTPNADGSNVTEPTGNGYARALLGSHNEPSTKMIHAPENGASYNDKEIHFSEATGAWGTCTYGCLFDADTEGQLLAFFPLTTSISPTTNTIPIIKVNNLTVAFEET